MDSKGQSYPVRKRVRLTPDSYAVPGSVVSIVACTARRAPLFGNLDLATACVQLLANRATVSRVSIHAYCLMPDHPHLLLSPSELVSVVDFVRDFKSRATRVAWQCGHVGPVWQSGFYDHILRKDEELSIAAEYILNNQVRKGVVVDRRKYPFSGSLEYDL